MKESRLQPFNISSTSDGHTYTIHGNATEGVAIRKWGIFESKQYGYLYLHLIPSNLDNQYMQLSLPRNMINGVFFMEYSIADFRTEGTFENISENSTHTNVSFIVPKSSPYIAIMGTSVIPIPSSSTVPNTVDSYWIIGNSIYWLIGVGIAAIGVIVGGIIGYRRWKRKK